MEGGAVRHNFERDTPRHHLCQFGPYIDAYCQVWFHLAKLFQRRRLKYEKVDGRQVMAILHMALWARWAKKWWKKGNNFKMGNQIYFKIAG
jgi:hypothetical protein